MDSEIQDIETDLMSSNTKSDPRIVAIQRRMTDSDIDPEYIRTSDTMDCRTLLVILDLLADNTLAVLPWLETKAKQHLENCADCYVQYRAERIAQRSARPILNALKN